MFAHVDKKKEVGTNKQMDKQRKRQTTQKLNPLAFSGR